MQEPAWEEIYKKHPEFEGRMPNKGDLVYVTGKTRGRFGALDIALPGAYGLVISRWNSSMGTPKVCILQEDGSERATTGSCVRVWGSFHTTGARDAKWYDIWLRWMDETYIPIIVCREKGFKRGWATSRDGSSVLVKPLVCKSGLQREGKIWLARDKVHPTDWELMEQSTESCVSLRVPLWLAKKGGLLGGV
jgi:hypothetical protein